MRVGRKSEKEGRVMEGVGREEQRRTGERVHVRELIHAQNTARDLALSG